MNAVLRSKQFWLAFFGLVTTIVYAVVPDFNQDVWLAVEALVLALIAAYTAEEVALIKAGLIPNRLRED